MYTHHEEEFSLKSYFVPFTTLKAIHWLIFIGLAVFFISLFNGYVGDDALQVFQNPLIQSLENIPAFFQSSTFYSGGGLAGIYFRPVLNTYFAITYSIFGSNIFVFHFVQVLFVIINACLLFLVLKYFFKSFIAFLLALIFLIHPINSEVAFYISDTQDVLFFFFGILSILIFQQLKTSKNLIWVSLGLLASLLSKETGILFFVLLATYCLLFKKKFLLPFLGSALLTFGLYIFLRISALGTLIHMTTNSPIGKLDFAGRLINMPEIFLFYIKTFIFPLNLAVSHQWIHRQISIEQFFLPLFFGLVFISILGLFGVFLYKKKLNKYFSYYIFFTLWFLFGILFHLQIISLDATVADRWFYFSSAGLLGLIGISLEVFKLNLRNKWIIPLILIIVLLLSMRTIIRSFDWKDYFTLASHDIKISQDAYPLDNALSHIYLKQGQFQKAKVHAERSVSIFPYDVIGYTNLGNVYYRMKDYEKAKSMYLKGLRYGDYFATYETLSAMALVYGDKKENIEFIKNVALKKYPQDGKIWLYLATLEYISGDKVNAKIHITQALKYDSGQEVVSVYNAIINNKPLNIEK